MSFYNLKTLVKKLAFIVVVTVGLLIFMEGLSSVIIFIKDYQLEKRSVINTEEKYTEFDTELGWVSLPNLFLKDFYGKGKNLTTNSRGFRGNNDSIASVTPSKDTIICSGDSFTLGYGVGDEATWCELLTKLNPDFETVNMGQGGYGLDQAYLWYKRDGFDIERKFHIFSFIGYDFVRTAEDNFRGYSKPVMNVVAGDLVVTNTPLIQKSFIERWLIQNGYLFTKLNAIKVISKAFGLPLPDSKTQKGEFDSNTWEVVTTIFDKLKTYNESRSARLVVMFLPSPWDYDSFIYDNQREMVADYSVQNNIIYVDLVDRIRQLDRMEAESLFFKENESGYPHLNEMGNVWVAKELIIYLE